MRCYISVVCALSVLAAISFAAPTSLQEQTLNEQANALLSVDSGSDGSTSLSGRFRRNIQLLRQLCPPLFQVIDNVIQNITSQIFRVVGRVVLQSGGLGGGGGGNGGGESQVSVVLPTFPPDEDEDEDEEEEGSVDTNQGGLRSGCDTSEDCENSIVNENRIGESSSATGESATDKTEVIPEIAEDNMQSSTENRAEILNELFSNDDSRPRETTTQTDNSDSNRNNIPVSSVDALFSAVAEVNVRDDNLSVTSVGELTKANDVDSSNGNAKTTTDSALSFDIKVVQQGNVVNTIPLANEVDGNLRETETQPPFTSPVSASADTARARRTIREAAEEVQEQDQEAAASGGNGPNPAEDLSDVDAEDADRDKRYLPFGGGDAHGAGGGSGNFLFDIIRLIAGSGATEESDEKEHAAGAGGVAEVDIAKEDGYTEGIPGPITRLFVIANRGLANLIQDLILRLAQTSERIVNFKARLITALI